MSAFDDLKAEIAAEKAQVMAGVNLLLANVASLEALLADGGHVTAEQIAELRGDIQNIFTPPPPTP